MKKPYALNTLYGSQDLCCAYQKIDKRAIFICLMHFMKSCFNQSLFSLSQYEPDWNIVPPLNDTSNILPVNESAGMLKSRVLEIIDKLLKEGIIYRAADPIGGMPSYHVSLLLPLVHTHAPCLLNLLYPTFMLKWILANFTGQFLLDQSEVSERKGA